MPSLPNPSKRPWVARMTQPGLPVWLAVIVACCALAVGLATPGVFPVSFLEEGGPVETATIYLYLAAVIGLVFARLPGLSFADKAALAVLLLACAAREADLHKELFGMSILKARFYTDFASPGQAAVALLVLLPVVAAVLFVIVRYRAWWRVRPSHWSAPVIAAVTFLVVMVIAKLCDRAPDTLLQLHLVHEIPSAVRQVMLSEEELLEMALPLLVLLATAQAAWAGRAGAPDAAPRAD